MSKFAAVINICMLMTTLHFTVMDKHANTVCKGTATPLSHSDEYEFKFMHHFVVVSSCVLPLGAFVRGQSEQGFCVSFASSDYFSLG